MIIPSMISPLRGLSFPNRLADDPLLTFVMPGADTFPDSEERRIFYVGLTRARRSVALFTIRGQRSPFLKELVQNGSVQVKDIEGRPLDDDPPCPSCDQGVIIERDGPYGRFHSCSNYPFCEYKPAKGWKPPRAAEPSIARTKSPPFSYRSPALGSPTDGSFPRVAESEAPSYSPVTRSVAPTSSRALLLTILLVILSAGSVGFVASLSKDIFQSEGAQSNSGAIPPGTSRENPIDWREAGAHIGRTVALEGPLRTVRMGRQVRGNPTWLDVGGMYPDRQRLSLIIWGDQVDSFSLPEIHSRMDSRVCVTGVVETYRGVPQIVLRSPDQFR